MLQKSAVIQKIFFFFSDVTYILYAVCDSPKLKLHLGQRMSDVTKRHVFGIKFSCETAWSICAVGSHGFTYEHGEQMR